MLGKILGLFLLTLYFSALSFAQTTPTPTPAVEQEESKEVIRISSELVLTDALVLDKDGRQVTNLTAEDFEILQDGKVQKITSFGYITSEKNTAAVEAQPNKKNEKNKLPLPPVNVRSNQGRVITFVLDDGNCLSTIGGIATARDAMKKFIDQQMLSDDKVAIYRTRGGTSLLQMYTSNKEALKRIINKVYWFPGACGSAFDSTKNDAIMKVPSENTRDTGQGTFENKSEKEFKADITDKERTNNVIGTMGVLSFVIERLKNLPQRKIVFLLSEGIYVKFGSMGYESLRELGDKASRSSVVIYTMSAKGMTIPGMVEARDEITSDEIVQGRIDEENTLNEGLRYLADTTGGRFIRNINNLDTGIRKILDSEKGYYLIGYQPDEETFKGKNFHKIEVKVKQTGLTIASRKGFFGRSDTESRPKYKSENSPMYQAIASPFRENGIDIRLTTLVGNDSKTGNFIRTLFHVKGEDLTFTDEADGTKKVVLDVVSVMLDEKGKVIEEFNRTYPIRIPKQGVSTVLEKGLDFSTDLPVKKPGFYSFRLAVRDNTSKRLGSAGDFVEIPDVKKGNFFMSGLITTDITKEGKPLIPKARPNEAAFAPVFIKSVPSIRQYYAGSPLAYAYDIYNAKLDATGQPKLTIQIKLYKEGKVIFEGQEKPAEMQPQTDMSRIQNYGFMRLGEQAETGEYILQVIVRDTLANKTASQWIDFEVIK